MATRWLTGGLTIGSTTDKKDVVDKQVKRDNQVVDGASEPNEAP